MRPGTVKARNISKRFRQQPGQRRGLKAKFLRRNTAPRTEFWPLRDISFELEPGDALGLVGRNGAGKSTALKVLAGIYRPTSGELLVEGTISTLLELGAGFHPELSGRENIRLSGALLGLSAREIEESLEEIISFSGLGKFIDTPIKVYSSGMRLRLGYAISIQVDPDVLFVDEIIAVGDVAFRTQCLSHMAKLRDKGTTMVVASHSMSTLTDLCERTLWLEEGRQWMFGPTEEVVAAYEEKLLRKALIEGIERGDYIHEDLEKMKSPE